MAEISCLLLPTGLLHTWDQSIAGQIAETNATNSKFAINSASPTAHPTTHFDTDDFSWKHHTGLDAVLGSLLQLAGMLFQAS